MEPSVQWCDMQDSTTVYSPAESNVKCQMLICILMSFIIVAEGPFNP